MHEDDSDDPTFVVVNKLPPVNVSMCGESTGAVADDAAKLPSDCG